MLIHKVLTIDDTLCISWRMKSKDIIKLRKDHNWSQRELASYLGVEQATVCRIERGDNKPSGPVAKLLYILKAQPTASGAPLE
jgi:DNA-binding transcriptional regulator YiaG